MRRSVPLLSIPLLAAAVLSLGVSCDRGRILIAVAGVVGPPDGLDVTSFSFPVVVDLTSDFDFSTLEVTLNGVPVTTTPGPGSNRWTVSANPGNGDPSLVNPGPPLLDQNELAVRARLQNSGILSQKKVLFDYVPPKARAFEITDPGDLIEGPMAHNRIGDYMLENSIARYVVQDVGDDPNASDERDLFMTGQFGGNLIDAELVSNPGHESFFEIQPMLNIESVINAQTIEIVNDGQDGTPAVVRTCGPDDLLDFINASSQAAEFGVSVPESVDDKDFDIHACTEYILAPEKRYVELDTTVTNDEPTAVRLYIGDIVAGGGELETFARAAEGPAAGVGEALVTLFTGFLGYYGFDEARGHDYALTAPRIVTSHVGNSESSTFTTSGVTFLLHSAKITNILAFGYDSWFRVVKNGGTRSFNRYFAVGDGSLANGLDLETEVKGNPRATLHGCVTVGGQPATEALVALGYTSSPPDITSVDSHFITDASGCYGGVIQPGSWQVVGAQQGAPYEGGGSTPLQHPISASDGDDIEVNIALPATGTLEVNATDMTGTPGPTPARVTVVGFDPSPPVLLSDISTSFLTVTSVFADQTKDPVPTGVSRTEYVGASGTLTFDLEPGDYQISVSRGTEYSVHKESVTLTAGQTTVVDADLVRVLDTPGFVSADYHVHLLRSPDSWISGTNRALSFAGEGVEGLIATDHNAVTDLGPTITSLLLTPWVHAIKGEEITSPDYGHYNAYPQGVDPTKLSGGSTDWSGAAPPGEDFPSFGNYCLTPAEIEAAAVAKPQNAGFETVVQVNHFDSHFNPLQIDTGLEPPQSFADGSLFRLDPSVPNYFHPFIALELWNGYNTGQQNEFLEDGRKGIWMNLLNQGYPVTGVADTDSHTFHNTRTAGARSWTPSSTDAPAGIVDNEIGLAVKAGKLVGGQGVYVKTRLYAASTGESAGFELGDATTLSVGSASRPGVRTTDGMAELQIEVQAPIWAPYDTIEIYSNATTNVVGTNGGIATLYDAAPDPVLTLSGTDTPTTFTRTTVDVMPSVAGAERFETSKTVPVVLPEDAWFVVIVRGTVGTSTPMFPVFPADVSLGQNPTLTDLETLTVAENGVRALGFTNPIYADVGNDGVFDPPGVSVAAP